jgi:hypothetical protein
MLRLEKILKVKPFDFLQYRSLTNAIALLRDSDSLLPGLKRFFSDVLPKCAKARLHGLILARFVASPILDSGSA